ncbi:MAG: TetR/AcrR family transcriptional regulator [Mycobacterium sp.]
MPEARSRKPPRTASPPRRKPSQGRSIELVHRLINATAQVLGEAGEEATSTNKIAARAGVAIGSLYQYFPNKEALIDALLDDRLHRLESMTADRMNALRADSYPQAAEAMLRAAVAFYEAEPEVTAMLASRTAMPRPGSRDQKLYQRGHDIARAYLQAHAGDFGIDDIELAATISTRVVGNFAPWIALSVTADDERDRFINEVVRMLSQWIAAPAT